MKTIVPFILVFILSLSGYAQDQWANAGTGISAFETDRNAVEIKVYPNPCTSQKVTVECNTQLIQEVKLTSITGKQVVLVKPEFPENKKQVQLNGIPSGVYFIQITTSENKKIVRKLLVTNS